MSKMLKVVAVSLSFVVLSSPLGAQSRPEAIVRQGDTIEWVHAGSGPPHKLKFGAAGTTPIAEIETILDFTPPLVNGESSATSGTLQKATVKDQAAVGKTLVFTCGFHPSQMLSLQFVVAAKVANEPSRVHKIVGEPGLHWHLHVDTTPQ